MQDTHIARVKLNYFRDLKVPNETDAYCQSYIEFFLEIEATQWALVECLLVKKFSTDFGITLS